MPVWVKLVESEAGDLVELVVEASVADIHSPRASASDRGSPVENLVSFAALIAPMASHMVSAAAPPGAPYGRDEVVEVQENYASDGKDIPLDRV